jgi:hypothetical protein
MKTIPLYLLFAASLGNAAETSPAKADSAPATYVEEAPLPAEWPKPGPLDKVVEKKYPAYRGAFTNSKGKDVSFLTLFLHIKKNDIPMTAPVEMAMADSDGKLEQAQMGFLYQNGGVGKPGPDGENVEVRDVPSCRVLSFAWLGEDSESNIAEARKRLEAELTSRKTKSSAFRLLGYNGPEVPVAERTWELQAVLE